MNIKDTYAGVTPLGSKRARFVKILLALLAVFLLLHLLEAPLFSLVQANWERLREAHEDSPRLFMAGFVLAHIAVLACFIPLGLAMMLMAGALFGIMPGLLLVSIAYTAGAMLNFLASRHFLRGAVTRRYPEQMEKIQRGLLRHGPLYLMLLRFFPLMPAPIVNVVFGTTRFPLPLFLAITWPCALPLLTFYLYLGSRAGGLANWSGIFNTLGF